MTDANMVPLLNEGWAVIGVSRIPHLHKSRVLLVQVLIAVNSVHFLNEGKALVGTNSVPHLQEGQAVMGTVFLNEGVAVICASRVPHLHRAWLLLVPTQSLICLKAEL